MIPELGHFALWLAFGLSLLLGTVPLAGALKSRGDWMATARPTAYALGACVLAAFVCLAASFVGNDFSVLYVARH